MHTVSLFDLNEHLRRVVALNFRDPLWITAEIAQINLSKGHFYLDLIQKGDGPTEESGIIAQAAAMLWARDYQRLRNTYGTPMLETVLSEGVSARLQVRVEFHERYGYKLHIEDIDPAFTLGQLAVQRRQTIETLQREQLMGLNKQVALPYILQRIAVITSEGAAGFQDFGEQLSANPFGYQFACTHFFAAVQGKNAASELTAALDLVATRQQEFDCIVVVRGGGGKLDLATFDDLKLCQTAARMPIPVCTGIGHDIDESVLDMVAHIALKTPTAVADFLVQRNFEFEQAALHTAQQVQKMASIFIKSHQIAIEQLESGIQNGARFALRLADNRLQQSAVQLPLLARNHLRAAHQQIEQAAAICAALHPDGILRRGYSMTLRDGKFVRSIAELGADDLIETRLQDGSVYSKVRE